MTIQQIIERIEAGSAYYTESGCLEWTEGRTPEGYGLVWIGGGKKDYVHRQMMKAHGHDIDGLTVDHLCALRGCSNPKHLEVVPNGENARRAHDPTWQAHLRTIRPTLGPYERLADAVAC